MISPLLLGFGFTKTYSHGASDGNCSIHVGNRSLNIRCHLRLSAHRGSLILFTHRAHSHDVPPVRVNHAGNHAGNLLEVRLGSN